MHVQIQPDTITKLLHSGTEFEPAGDHPREERKRAPRQATSLMECITHLSTPKGKKPVLKAMLTTACERNCFYCPFRAGRSMTRRLTFSPDEMARGFETLYRGGLVDGLFLSSGIIKGSITTQDRIIATAEIIRKRYHYDGYLHLKIMPGIQYEQLYRIMQLADRVSVNLEGPTEERLSALAPKKEFMHELLRMLQLAEQIRREHPHERLASTVTQFVVGAVGDTDLELMTLSQQLYRQMGLTRAYYSAFTPVQQTPFEQLPATSELRELRLYQASFLVRSYGWNINELPFQENGNLLTTLDPKRAWAERHLRQAPVEVMTASHARLMRVPGIGPQTASAILAARRTSRLTDLSQLRALGMANPEQAAPYLLLSGRRPLTQRTLF
ncbi:putative DNA-binding helix-hairpin-helix protein [Thermosporothrix hazakensis]|jgi:predicted DNA-binding helix-hairpin-helix protein|uniref:Putative DNA-binding helix-hairpin-helix protein n=1 Tax=Thermosporothrix hazakensis TaxID=644383 RepID=A0A326U7P3_THEHA|nr:radical SAM protein [Thermosporothrix hazakensis]PZW29542.1 putative DNA-binding helix-hairpin-helix protein [Thermosporothrix hazakensis]GCE45744.1 putative DNA modification/repair radical SAM protein [Thermosporothrix hazakensis]